MPLNDSLIPVRFLTTSCHFITVIMIHIGRVDNIKAQLGNEYTKSEYDEVDSSLKGAVALSIICFIITLLSLIAGFTMLFPTINFIHIIFHFGGVVNASNFITEGWGAREIWWLFCSYNLFPTIVEICALISIFVFKVYKY
eukprot:TRINITY_DN10300_c0_g1_i1.p1 TRINITY_DN10300_c0_g1~~TRINITY_DN10300_c0_g1_i1.p1  ORF type:complete len:141 (+),score=19.28 TRINITY_DN10300_c0_g1_i1:55-477(+)